MRSNRVHGNVGRKLGPGQLVLHDQLMGQRGAGTFVGFVEFGQQETHLPERPPDLARNEALAAPAVEMRRQLAGDVAAHLVAERVDFFVHPAMAMQSGQHVPRS
ncbi:hypothetical protein D9M68_851970 [compost metagenome]